MFKYLLTLFFLVSVAVGAQRIAITFDDFPMGPTCLHEKEQRVALYLEKLDRLGIQTVFFCVGSQLDSPLSDRCLEMAAAHNQLLANHSFSHPHLSKQPLELFYQELVETDVYLQPYATSRKWYRFPFLDYGDQAGGSAKKRLEAFRLLNQEGYSHGYITINTYDWHVNHLMLKELKEKKDINLEQIKEVYLSLLEGWIDGYHQSWKKCLKNSFCHVLLLHQNDLNLLFLEDIVDMIQAKGWEIVSPDEAFASPLVLLSKFAHTPRSFKHPQTLSIEYIDSCMN